MPPITVMVFAVPARGNLTFTAGRDVAIDGISDIASDDFGSGRP